MRGKLGLKVVEEDLRKLRKRIKKRYGVFDANRRFGAKSSALGILRFIRSTPLV